MSKAYLTAGHDHECFKLFRRPRLLILRLWKTECTLDGKKIASLFVWKLNENLALAFHYDCRQQTFVSITSICLTLSPINKIFYIILLLLQDISKYCFNSAVQNYNSYCSFPRSWYLMWHLFIYYCIMIYNILITLLILWVPSLYCLLYLYW